MTSQLLIEMPAEGAARLLTLSLLEQLWQYADPRQVPRRAETYRAAVRRLRASMTLYADALGDSVPRKARRRVGELVDVAERVNRLDVQLVWAARHAPTPAQRETGESLGDGARAAAWLYDRLGRRRERALRLLQRSQTETRPLRRIAKRLGVYTTTVRLDAAPPQRSFARMTSDQLLVTADALGAAMRRALGPANHRELRLALRSAEHIAYLLDPLRAYVDVEVPSARVAQLRGELERLDQVMTVGRSLIRGGRRIAALHVGETLHAVIWPPSEAVVVAAAENNGRMLASPAELQRGLVVLAEALHDESIHAFDALTAVWQESGGDASIERITAIAAELQG